jgi:uncharacterized protein (DUF849 family)
MTDVMLTGALTGPIATKEDNAALPTTAEEIAQAGRESWEAAGASIVHVHLRDSAGRPTADLEVRGTGFGHNPGRLSRAHPTVDGGRTNRSL